MPLILCSPYQALEIDDPYKSQVTSSASFSGTPGSTVIADQNGKIFDNHGVTLSAANSKFGGTSAYFDGASYMSTPSAPENTFGTQDWTIDFWFSPNSVANQYQEIITKGAGIQIYMTFDTIMLACSSNNTTSYFVIAGFGKLTTNKWFHIATQKSGNIYTGYLNGVGTTLGVNSSSADTGSSPLVIGSYLSGYYPILGYMNNFRITKGVARYTGNFTPPTS